MTSGAALKELRTAVELDPANAGAHRLLARIYSEQSDFLAAEAELRKALASKPSAELHFELGLTEGQLGNLERAAAEFRRALQLNPRFAPAHTLLGVTLRRQGDHAGALAQFRQSVEIDPKDPESQTDLGMELKAGGDTAGAIAAFQSRDRAEARFRKGPLQSGDCVACSRQDGRSAERAG